MLISIGPLQVPAHRDPADDAHRDAGPSHEIAAVEARPADPSGSMPGVVG